MFALSSLVAKKQKGGEGASVQNTDLGGSGSLAADIVLLVLGIFLTVSAIMCISLPRIGFKIFRFIDEKLARVSNRPIGIAEEDFPWGADGDFLSIFDSSGYDDRAGNETAREQQEQKTAEQLMEAQQACRKLVVSSKEARKVVSEAEWCCPICLENSALPIARLPCMHSAHAGCLERWFFHGRKACPLCQSPAESVESRQPFEADVVATDSIVGDSSLSLSLSGVLTSLSDSNIHLPIPPPRALFEELSQTDSDDSFDIGELDMVELQITST